MNDNIINRVKKEKLEKAVEIIKTRLGEGEAKKVEAAFGDSSKLQALLDGLGKKEIDTIVKLINNPDVLQSLVASPKVADIIRQFIDK